MVRTAVTARRAEKNLARNEELFRLLAENSRNLVYRYTLVPEPRFEYVSPAATKISGYTPEEHYADPSLPEKMVHPEDRHLLREMTSDIVDSERPLLVRWVTKDGRVIWVEETVIRIRDRDGEIVAFEGTVVDVTERVKAEKELKESEAHYRSIFETAGSAMVIIDEDGTLQSVNPLFERLTGYSKEEVEGKVKWDSLVDPADAEKIMHEYMTDASDPEAVPRGLSIRTRDKFGSELALLAYATEIPGTGRVVVSMVDETERRRFEDAIQQASRKMDLLARITRHDIMNQLAVLYGYLELALERIPDPEQQAPIAKARMASESIKRHLEFARDYQNMGRKRPQWIDVQAACKRAASNIELKGARVVVELAGLEVFSDPMLEKVFYNLIDNSLKHGQRTTKITFRHIHGPEGMRLVYEDDGVGIPSSEKKAIFERSGGDREGRRGYGLYLAREILGITGITLEETGVHGECARFELLVPKGKYRTTLEPDGRKRGKRLKRS
ncbi:MAG: PAS domain S-box protein [Thermoplasmata archaeon]